MCPCPMYVVNDRLSCEEDQGQCGGIGSFARNNEWRRVERFASKIVAEWQVSQRSASYHVCVMEGRPHVKQREEIS